MGLNVSINLVIGVQLLNCGVITPTDQEKSLYDSLGNLTGKKATLKRVYWTLPNGKEFLLGQNDLSNQYNDINWFFLDISDDLPDGIEIFLSEYKNIDTAIVGMRVNTSHELSIGRYEAFKASLPEELALLVKETKEIFKKELGYIDDIYVFSQASYSY